MSAGYNMITPPYLMPGDRIGVMSPSSRAAPEDLEASAQFLRRRGYDVFIHPQSFLAAPPLPDGRFTQYAGTPAEKAAALHDLVRDDGIKAIFFATGGQRAITILDHLDFELIKTHPKIYLGFSDNTLLLNAITAKTGLVTYHGPTFKRLVRNPQADFNLRFLSGQEREISLAGSRTPVHATVRGKLVGGNGTLMLALKEDEIPDLTGSILFLEDIGEELTSLDRALAVMKRRGWFAKAAALIFGQYTGMLDTGTPFGMTFDEIVSDHLSGLDLPVVTNAPFGHGDDLTLFPIGATMTLDTACLTLKF